MRASCSAILRLDRVEEIQTTGARHHFAILQNSERIPLTRNIPEVESRLRRHGRSHA
jgi:hypothetical protein